MLGWDISVYKSNLVCDPEDLIENTSGPQDKFDSDNQIISWSRLNLGGLSALIPLDLEKTITVLNRTGYPCLYFLPFGLIKNNFIEVSSWQMKSISHMHVNRKLIAELTDDQHVFVEAWDQS